MEPVHLLCECTLGHANGMYGPSQHLMDIHEWFRRTDELQLSKFRKCHCEAKPKQFACTLPFATHPPLSRFRVNESHQPRVGPPYWPFGTGLRVVLQYHRYIYWRYIYWPRHS